MNGGVEACVKCVWSVCGVREAEPPRRCSGYLPPFNALGHRIDFEPVCLNARTLQPLHRLLILEGGGSEVSQLVLVAGNSNFFVAGSSWRLAQTRRSAAPLRLLWGVFVASTDHVVRNGTGEVPKTSLSPGESLPHSARGDEDLLPPAIRLSVRLGPPLPPRTCFGGLRTGQGVRQEATSQETHPAGVQTVQPQRGREDPGGQRETRGQNYAQLRSIQRADAQLQHGHYLQG